jgi:hypothetical protein
VNVWAIVAPPRISMREGTTNNHGSGQHKDTQTSSNHVLRTNAQSTACYTCLQHPLLMCKIQAYLVAVPGFLAVHAGGDGLSLPGAVVEAPVEGIVLAHPEAAVLGEGVQVPVMWW